MNVIGFRELHWHRTLDGPSLRESVRPEPHPDAARIAAYLRGGSLLAVRPMVVPDFLRPEREMASASHWHTDGEWIWPTDLVYYLEEHHVALPPAFVARMAAAGWACPAVPDDQLARVVAWWCSNR